MLSRRSVLAAGLGGLAGVAGAAGAGAQGLQANSLLGPEAAGTVLINTSAKINHVAVDAENLYWTETSATTTRLRKKPLAGGAAVDLASEPAKDQRGFRVSYTEIQLTAETIVWNRERVGFYAHYSLRTIAKDGGNIKVILKEDYSESPLSLNGWRVVGNFVVVALLYPYATPIDLPKPTRIAGYDLDTGTWSAVISGRFKQNEAFVLAGDDQTLYVHGTGKEGNTVEIGSVLPSAGATAYTSIRSAPGKDLDLAQQGATDGTNLYYWSKSGNKHRIMALATQPGGTPTVVTITDLGVGLTTDKVDLYWQVQDTVFKIAVGGQGSPVKVFKGAYKPSAAGGLAFDDTSLYLAVQSAAKKFQIVQVAK